MVISGETVLLILLLWGGVTSQFVRYFIGITFCCFAAYSTWSWFAGATSCACFGFAMRIPQTVVIALDLVTLLLVCCFSNLSIRVSTAQFQAVLSLTRKLTLGTFLVLTAGSVFYGSLTDFVASLTGKVLVVSEPYVLLGRVPTNTDHEVVFTVRNISPHTVTIVGVRKSCELLFLQQLPIVVSPGSSLKIVAKLKPLSKRAVGILNAKLELLIDVPTSPIVLNASAVIFAPADGDVILNGAVSMWGVCSTEGQI